MTIMQKSALKSGLMALVALCALVATAASAQVQTLDRVVAVVDDDVVMASELQQRLNTIMSQIQAQQVQAPPIDILRRQVLEQLIIERLQLQMAARAGVTISEAELDQAIARVQQNAGMSPEAFRQQLAADGISMKNFRHQIRQEMLIRRVEQGSVNRRIQITDQDIDNFLRSKEGEFWKSPQYELGHILIPVNSSAPADEVKKAREKAEQLARQAREGADFRRLAIANSAGQNALSGGDLGWRKTVELPTLFADALEGLKVGDVTDPFRSDAGFHLLKIHAQRGATEQVVEQTKVRHILIKPSAILSDDDAYNKLVELREQIEKGADFAKLARENSEDIGTMLQGGDLGWSMPGQFVPEFTQAMNNTPVGQISMPFRSQFGWHILKVEGRRKQDMTDQYIRNQAANLLRNRRYEEELQNWRREIRDQAYVEINLPDMQEKSQD
ncbi:peptidylprolyl isomerase [Microbulbifer thermotolerans]|uniref:Chaperone SurA n=1 Tax=Microbulbifer thermotolerans TaxID=252514 RepID=A0A143HII0_MICTH|nr:peptidylprolyl isomerase [Microbulbifer thermotolerans]AMX01524.1 molecular chaperone SurA [Microbulbifer thermotolerans]MCX2778375.1 peptidylprolyl isomerase [Microbulbifer thermotolerans]MCX2784207.1 peptidylprolyl isomerase [Microbulbifer thermotolerans]MCX2796144.1 peptidylprolyl isomerase [Microbulbifer thermotolerans]MCX2803011.1 peptidylprolyl isomerase [Microbulbifer thermotolerans]